VSTSATAWHATAAPALQRLAASTGPTGVILGRDHGGALAPVRLLRAEPTRVAVVGGPWLAHLLVFRCLAVGAFAGITTTSPARWMRLAELAGVSDRVSITTVAGSSQVSAAGPPPSAEPPVARGSLQPVLLVTDTGVGGGSFERSALPSWHTQVTVLPTLTAANSVSVSDAHVVLLQRLRPEEASICVAALRLTAPTEHKLQQLHDEMLAVVISGIERYLWFATTSVEHEILGPPHRDP